MNEHFFHEYGGLSSVQADADVNAAQPESVILELSHIPSFVSLEIQQSVNAATNSSQSFRLSVRVRGFGNRPQFRRTDMEHELATTNGRTAMMYTGEFLWQDSELNFYFRLNSHSRRFS